MAETKNLVQLIQFEPKTTRLIDGVMQKNYYKFDRQQAYENFKNSAAYFAGFLMDMMAVGKSAPIINGMKLKWLKFIKTIMLYEDYEMDNSSSNFRDLNRFNELDYNDMPSLTLEQVSDMMDLDIDKMKQYRENRGNWGPNLWLFLHNTSFMVDGNQIFIETFAGLMLNFNLVMYCSICVNGYVAKDPLQNVVIPMVESSDPITVIFQLHNLVNKSTNKPNLSIEAFCNLYNCNITDSESISYSRVIVI